MPSDVNLTLYHVPFCFKQSLQKSTNPSLNKTGSEGQLILELPRSSCPRRASCCMKNRVPMRILRKVYT
ncbi:Uncharacterised protein [Edwardsiella hoshinae]|uniref:Uncharacterized protein n=1 Tax=Edwardsiella hoshinae TaxID=93378 RepID=A0A376DHS9_9GAMM|nr:Uncharacterised protein [Edwardsiella hoshinae]STE53357.1 Uncharacterised protein [Edwardsiella hoshinae]STE53374.1 Uncharacterised protein [Edwardsiella hoshinae]